MSLRAHTNEIHTRHEHTQTIIIIQLNERSHTHTMRSLLLCLSFSSIFFLNFYDFSSVFCFFVSSFWSVNGFLKTNPTHLVWIIAWLMAVLDGLYESIQRERIFFSLKFMFLPSRTFPIILSSNNAQNATSFLGYSSFFLGLVFREIFFI